MLDSIAEISGNGKRQFGSISNSAGVDRAIKKQEDNTWEGQNEDGRSDKKRKQNDRTTTVDRNMIRTSLLKKQLSDQIDRELGNRYYQQACKESCDNMYYIVLCSMALALHDCNPAWSCFAIGKRLQLTMDYIDRFANEYEGNIEAYMERVEEETGLKITVDSWPKSPMTEGEEKSGIR